MCTKSPLPLLLLASVFSVLAPPVQSAEPTPATLPGDGQSVKLPAGEVHVGRQTTRIGLSPDGSIDYIGQLNARCAQGVTPQNNAAIVFAQALGENLAATSEVKKFRLALAIPAPPADAPLWQNFEAYLKSQNATDAEHWQDELDDIENHGWQADTAPRVKSWLDANEKVLVALGTPHSANRPRKSENPTNSNRRPSKIHHPPAPPNRQTVSR